ncbi:MAG: hypothetical protein KAI17_20170 [Thiotrichaceae bacterium]|nr:hypothetical protein [Thiotrichaceae bacterium]
MKKGIVLILLLLSQGVFAGSYNNLKMQIRTIYPEEITSIEKALIYLLEPTGYELALYPLMATAPQESGVIVAQALSPLARTRRVMSIEKALLQVIGNENALVVDHEHKLISVQPFVK